MNDILDFIDNVEESDCDFSELIEILKEENIYDYKLSHNHITFTIKLMKCDITFNGSQFNIDFHSLDEKKVNTMDEVIKVVKEKFEFLHDNKENVEQLVDLIDMLKSHGINANWGVLSEDKYNELREKEKGELKELGLNKDEV